MEVITLNAYICSIKIEKQTKSNIMKNLVKQISNKEAVSNFKITEAFFSQGEFYMTSEWDVPFEIANEIENQLRSL